MWRTWTNDLLYHLIWRTSWVSWGVSSYTNQESYDRECAVSLIKLLVADCDIGFYTFFVLSLDCESNDHSNANDMNLFAKSLRLYMLLWPGLLRRDQNRTIRQTSHCLDVVWRGFNPTWQLHQNTSELACNVMLVTLQSQCDFKHLDDSVHWIWKTVRRASVVSTCYRYTCCSRVCLSPGIAGEKRRKIGFISASLPPHRWRSVLGRCGVVFVHPQSVDPQCHPTE